jgi:hypothetical protein
MWRDVHCTSETACFHVLLYLEGHHTYSPRDTLQEFQHTFCLSDPIKFTVIRKLSVNVAVTNTSCSYGTRDLGFSQRCTWGLKSCGVWRCVFGSVVLEVWTAWPLNMKAPPSLETSETDHPVTQCHIPKHLNLNQLPHQVPTECTVSNLLLFHFTLHRHVSTF